jgi:urease subunit alpha
VAELFDMIMVCHNLNPKIPSDVAFSESRVRGETIVAESVLHDIGALSMIGSDSQAMGRVGETFLRAIQTADAMKKARGKLPEDAKGNDNFRVLRYLAKVTLNPCITAGVAHMLGSIAPGKLADLVLWEPAFFGAKPKLVLKGGFVVWANMGDPNASLAPPQPMFYRPMFGAHGSALQKTCVTFVSQVAYDLRVHEKYGLERIIEPVRQTRVLTKEHMVLNSLVPNIDVNPDTFAVTIDGVHLTVTPPKTISLNQLYFFS